MILKFCKKNITVVAFIPPDPVEVAQEVHKNVSPYAQSQNKLVKNIAEIFSENKSTFLDLSDISLYGGKDEEFIDLIHGGDLVYAKMLLYLTERDGTLRKYVDVSALERMVRTTQGDFIQP